MESEEDAVIIGNKPPKEKEKEEELTPEQMSIVLGSMSDNRISDSVKDIVEEAAGDSPGEDLTDEQRNIVLGSMSDNRISDSVKDIVEKNS